MMFPQNTLQQKLFEAMIKQMANGDCRGITRSPTNHNQGVADLHAAFLHKQTLRSANDGKNSALNNNYTHQGGISCCATRHFRDHKLSSFINLFSKSCSCFYSLALLLVYYIWNHIDIPLFYGKKDEKSTNTLRGWDSTKRVNLCWKIQFTFFTSMAPSSVSSSFNWSWRTEPKQSIETPRCMKLPVLITCWPSHLVQTRKVPFGAHSEHASL